VNTALVPAHTVWFVGCPPITGIQISVTVTVNEHVAVLPAASFTIYVIVVTPCPVVPFKLNVCVPTKLIPVAGEAPVVAPVIVHVSVVTAQLSAVIGLATAIVAVHNPTSVGTVILAGHVIVGTCASSTVIVNVQVATPQVLVAVAVTVVVPTGKNVPDPCE
jgi:hypothetical protein